MILLLEGLEYSICLLGFVVVVVCANHRRYHSFPDFKDPVILSGNVVRKTGPTETAIFSEHYTQFCLLKQRWTFGLELKVTQKGAFQHGSNFWFTFLAISNCFILLDSYYSSQWKSVLVKCQLLCGSICTF